MLENSQEIDISVELLCPIGMGIMLDPVLTVMGQVYDRCNIEKWFEDHDTDPLTNVRLNDTRLVVDTALARRVQSEYADEFLEKIRKRRLEEKAQRELELTISFLDNLRKPDKIVEIFKKRDIQVPYFLIDILCTKPLAHQYLKIIDDKIKFSDIDEKPILLYFAGIFPGQVALLEKFFKDIQSVSEFKLWAESLWFFMQYISSTNHTLPGLKEHFLRLPAKSIINFMTLFNRVTDDAIQSLFTYWGLRLEDMVEWTEDEVAALVEVTRTPSRYNSINRLIQYGNLGNKPPINQIKQLSQFDLNFCKTLFSDHQHGGRWEDFRPLFDTTGKYTAGIPWDNWLNLWQNEGIKGPLFTTLLDNERHVKSSKFSMFIGNIKNRCLSEIIDVDESIKNVELIHELHQTVSISQLYRYYLAYQSIQHPLYVFFEEERCKVMYHALTESPRRITVAQALALFFDREVVESVGHTVYRDDKHSLEAVDSFKKNVEAVQKRQIELPQTLDADYEEKKHDLDEQHRATWIDQEEKEKEKLPIQVNDNGTHVYSTTAGSIGGWTIAKPLNSSDFRDNPAHHNNSTEESCCGIDLLVFCCIASITAYHGYAIYKQGIFPINRYPFQLINLISFVMLLLVMISLCTSLKYQRESKHFSNALELALKSSITLSLLYTTYAVFNPQILSGMDMTDSILVYGVMTCLFFVWMGYKKQLPSDCCSLNYRTWQSKKESLFWKGLIPLALIALYAGLTVLGQYLFHQPVNNWIDWSNCTHTGKTLEMFGITIGVFILVSVLYHLPTCLRKPEDSLDSLPEATNYQSLLTT